jgi:hypothetical protein
MKINTLTTYDVYNYGASLQAYALQNYLIQQGHDVEIINYQPEYLTRKYNYMWVNPESKMSKYLCTRIIYRILKFLQRQTTLKRKKQFDVFNHQILKVTRKKYLTYEELKNNPPNADLYIVGSDQIWNTFYETGRDSAFYLEFVQKGEKASYAASFSYLDIDSNNLRRIQKSLEKFKAVSVREYHGLKILEKINISGTWVLDPVFLLSTKDWKKLMTNFCKTEKYLLIYDFEKNELLKDFAIEYAKQKNLKIYSINDTYPLPYADRNFNNAGPKEFLSLIYNCDAFISNSFHGTAFSIIFNKPVFVFNRHRHKVNSRMESIMTLFELNEFIINNKTEFKKAINTDFNFDQINSIKEKEIVKSKQFINLLLT